MSKVSINLNTKQLIDPEKFILSWCVDNIDWFILDEDTKYMVQDEVEEQREVNIMLNEIEYPYW